MQMTDTSVIVYELFEQYRQEGLTLPYTMKDFRRDIARKYLNQLTPEERLAGLPAEERLAGLTAEQIEAYLKRLRKAAGGHLRFCRNTA